MNDMNILSHTKWNCKYHIVFAPKYRRKVLKKKKRIEVGKIFKAIMCVKKNKNNRSISMPRSCTDVGRDTAESINIKFYGILKGKK